MTLMTHLSTEIFCIVWHSWSTLVMWLECRFLDTEVDGSASVCCVLGQDTLSALLQSTQL